MHRACQLARPAAEVDDARPFASANEVEEIEERAATLGLEAFVLGGIPIGRVGAHARHRRARREGLRELGAPAKERTRVYTDHPNADLVPAPPSPWTPNRPAVADSVAKGALHTMNFARPIAVRRRRATANVESV